MTLEYQILKLRSVRERPNDLINPIVLWLAIIFISCLAAYFSFRIVSSVDFNNLIPVPPQLLLEAIPLIFILYFIGIALVGCLAGNVSQCFSLFTIAFLLRIILSIVLAYLFQFDDERAFHLAGLEQQYEPFLWSPSRGYYQLVSTLYAVFGPNLLLPKAVNSLLGSLLPFLAYGLGQRLFSDTKAAWLTLLFAAFLPPLVIFSAVNLKEVPTAFLLVLTLWFLIVPRRSVLWKMMGVLLSIGALYWLRGAPWAAVASTGVVVYLLVGKTWRIRNLPWLGWVPNLIMIGLWVFAGSQLLIGPIHEDASSRSTRENYYIERFADSSATVTKFLDVSNPLSPKNLGVLFLRGLYSPSPIRIFVTSYSLDTIMEAFNMTIWYLLAPFAISGFVARHREGPMIACGVTALGVLIMASMGVMVGSDPYRHRMTMMGLFFTLVGGGFKREVFRRKRWIVYLWWLGAFLFTAVWLLFKI